jgi:hypothetical protein
MKRIAAAGALLVVMACGPTLEPVEPVATHQVQAGDTVALGFGESAVVDGELRLTFTAVEGDSRCPTDVTCVWAGDAHIELRATRSGTPAETIELHTGADPREAELAGYRIRLLRVEPAAQQSGPPAENAYSVVLSISRG